MLLGKEKTTQDYIVECLAKKPQKIDAIQKYISHYKKITRPAIYDQLRKLISDGVILKNKTEYFISNEWVEKIRDFFAGTGIPHLNEGESLTYIFKSLHQMDQFWKHVFPIYHNLYKSEPIYMYDNHCFWVYIEGRTESEDQHYKSYKPKKRRAYFLIGGETKLDFDFKRKYNNKYLKINAVKIKPIKNTDHITVIGNIVINSKTPADFSKNIHKIYEDKKMSKEEKIKEINKEVKKIKKVYFKIEHNKKKAEKYKKIIGRDFV